MNKKMNKNEMQCKNFREIADSYLSDELLVETNHEVFRHLENCENCRRDLGGRREVRAKLCSAIINSTESQIDRTFAANLRQRLEKEAFRKNGFTDFFRMSDAPKIFALSAAALIIAVLIGFSFWNNPAEKDRIAANNNVYKTAWMNISEAAAEDHNHCGLGKYDYWNKNDATENAEEKAFEENVLNEIQSKTDQSVKLVSIHDCYAMGKKFHHAIMNIGDHVVSITQTASEIVPNANATTNLSELYVIKREDFELAGFAGNGEVFYVISDFPEAENTRIAKIFSGSLQARTATALKFTSRNYALYSASANF